MRHTAQRLGAVHILHVVHLSLGVGNIQNATYCEILATYGMMGICIPKYWPVLCSVGACLRHTLLS